MKLSARLPSTLVLTSLVGIAFAAHAGTLDGADLAGHGIAAAEATQTIVIGPQTRYVNIDSGDSVLFKTPAGQFAWHADAENAIPFDLSKIAPAGSVDHPVAVYIRQGVDDPYAG